MSGIGNDGKDEYTFKKLHDSHNNKQWSWDMSFALEKARLQKYIEGIAITPLFLVPNRDKSKDWTKKIYTQEEKICKFTDNACNIIAKIRKMYTKMVQKEFLSVKASKNWIFKNLQNHFKT